MTRWQAGEEQSDEAISIDCFASLAMTKTHSIKDEGILTIAGSIGKEFPDFIFIF